MTTFPVPSWLQRLFSPWLATRQRRRSAQRPDLTTLARLNPTCLPRFVQESAVALQYLRLLGMLEWSRFPNGDGHRFAPERPPLPHAALAAAYLIKLDQQLPSVSDLRQYLVQHPALVWVLGFPLSPSPTSPWGFDLEAALPTHRHFSRLLRTIPNASFQVLLDETIRLLLIELSDELPPDFPVGDCVSVDTKHVIAWVKENNPKAYVERRFDKSSQPKGDPDCRLGCKRKTNQHKRYESVESLPTPLAHALPASQVPIGEYYWGYGSGIVATKLPGWTEFVLAELTQPFDQPDVSYFQPLMAEVERRLGRKPRFGAFDAAFDAFYVYEYFAAAHGFAAVPFVARGRPGKRLFSSDGAPLCAAGLPMTLRYTFRKKTTLIPHQCQRYVCPLRFPQTTAAACPVQHKNWSKSGCVATLAASSGARLRYQVDRDSELYQDVYKQRTATERINSQAVALGIERPHLRNAASIANHNTLTYILINLHALQRIRQRKTERRA